MRQLSKRALVFSLLALFTTPAAATVSYTYSGDAFGDYLSFSTAAPITTQTILTPTTCGTGGVSFASTCKILLRPAGSAPTTFNGLSFSEQTADGLAIAFDSGDTYYTEFATNAFSVDGDHSIGKGTLNVSGAPVSPTQTSYSFSSDFFKDAFTWTGLAPITTPTVIRPETCKDSGAVAYNCEVLFNPANSPTVKFGPFAPLPPQSDDYLIIDLGADEPFDKGGNTFYTDAYQAGSFVDDGVHNGVGSTLAVAGLLSPAPEPETWTMMVAGFGLIGYGFRRRSNSAVNSAA